VTYVQSQRSGIFMDWALIGAKSDKLPDGEREAQKEDVSGETRTYGNPTI